MPEQEFISSSPRCMQEKGFGNEHLAEARQISPSSDVSTSTKWNGDVPDSTGAEAAQPVPRLGCAALSPPVTR